MKVRDVPRVAGAMMFIPDPHCDERGFFCRTFDTEVVGSAGIDAACFSQDSVSRSSRGVVQAFTSGGGTARPSWCVVRMAPSSM